MVLYLNDIYNFFKQYFVSSLYLKDFYFDNLIRILSKKDVKYPCLMVVPEGASMNKRVSKINLSVIIVDRLYDGETNWLDVLSQTHKGLYDVVSYLTSISGIKVISENDFISVNEIRDTFNDDEVAGWQALITIDVEAFINYCELPLTTMPDVLLQQNGNKLLQENTYPILLN